MPDRGRTGVPTELALAVVVGTAVVAVAAGALPTAPSVAAATLSVDGDRIVLEYRAGDAIDVRRLDVTVSVDGEPLVYQPPVPFFSARGFRPGPTGPFNVAADPYWEVGERASVRLAATNRPSLRPGARVTVELTYRGRRLAVLSATA